MNNKVIHDFKRASISVTSGLDGYEFDPLSVHCAVHCRCYNAMSNVHVADFIQSVLFPYSLTLNPRNDRTYWEN